jgi:peptide-methionine (S)-S-oxide reductase
VKIQLLALFLSTATVLAPFAQAAEKKVNTESTPTNSSSSAHENVTFGGGCFWCLEAVFQRLKGVKSVVSGYAGGSVPNPTYEQVCEGNTGHAEVVKISFDPNVLSFDKLMQVFFAAHDPTTLNRQGHDTGTQYRSIILYESDAQKAAAETAKVAAQKDFKDPIVTQIVPLKQFYAAEAHHQNYFNQNAGTNPYCSVVIRPKLQKLLKEGLIAEPH